jgi:hypothetical protein
MKVKAALVLLLICAMAFAANAQKDGGNDTGDQQVQPGDCPVDNYKGFYMEEFAEFDCDFRMFGPMPTVDDGTTIEDVILDLDILQTWVGDLVVKLYYDVDCDGTPDYGPVAALCRAQLDGCTDDQGDCCGCSGDLDGVYRFSDAGPNPLGEFECPGYVEPGCYGPAIETEYGFDVFQGLPKGGCFWLRVLDGACLDGTLVRGWQVWVLNGEPPNAAQQTTWGAIKALY